MVCLFSHGKQKFWTGAGLYGLGAVTGNAGLKNTGAGLAKLGLLTKGAAHFFWNGDCKKIGQSIFHEYIKNSETKVIVLIETNIF